MKDREYSQFEHLLKLRSLIYAHSPQNFEERGRPSQGLQDRGSRRLAEIPLMVPVFQLRTRTLSVSKQAEGKMQGRNWERATASFLLTLERRPAS